jgi:hypothetical protein
MSKLLLLTDLDGNQVVINETDINFVRDLGSSTSNIIYRDTNSTIPKSIDIDETVANIVSAGTQLLALSELSLGTSVAINEADVVLVVDLGSSTSRVTYNDLSSSVPKTIDVDDSVATIVSASSQLLAATELNSSTAIAINRMKVKGAENYLQVNPSGTITFASGAGTVTDIEIDGNSIFDTGTAITGASLALLATNTAAAINAYTSTGGFTAVANGAVVTVTATTPSEALNGEAITTTLTSTLATTTTALAGGVNDCTVVYDNGGSFLEKLNINKSLVELTTYA